MSGDINQRCTAALRALEAAGAVRIAIPCGWSIQTKKRGPGTMLSDQGVWVIHAKSRWVPMLPGDVVDLSDPVTAASLIVLVREAWGTRDWSIEQIGDEFTLSFCCGPKDEAHEFIGASLEAVCVAALEAKAQEVSGTLRGGAMRREGTITKPWAAGSDWDDLVSYIGDAEDDAVAEMVEAIRDEMDRDGHEGRHVEVTIYERPVYCPGRDDYEECPCGMSHDDFDGRWVMLSWAERTTRTIEVTP